MMFSHQNDVKHKVKADSDLQLYNNTYGSLFILLKGTFDKRQDVVNHTGHLQDCGRLWFKAFMIGMHRWLSILIRQQ